LAEPVGIPGATIDAARFDGTAIRRQIVEPPPEIRVDVFLQHIGARVDMRIGVIDTEAVLHG